METLSFLRETIRKLSRWLGMDAQVIVHDMHPDLLTTRLAHELAAQRAALAQPPRPPEPGSAVPLVPPLVSVQLERTLSAVAPRSS
jgi:hypothetical protein